MSHRVLDVGCGRSPDDRATETADIAGVGGVDHQFDIRDRWPIPDDALVGVILSHVIEHVRDPIPVFREAARVLESGGWLEVTVPIGMDTWADPDHERAWTYDTFEIISGERDRHWDVDLGFDLQNRHVTVDFFRPLSPLTPLANALARLAPREVCLRASRGEITGRYRRVTA